MSKADETAIPAVTVGTVAFVVALIVLTIRDGIAPPEQQVWWWGAALVGAASGVVGLAFLAYRRRRLPDRGES